MTNHALQIRYFTSYSGISLPLKLVGEIASDDMTNRNTFFEGHFNRSGQLCLCLKKVYGETELEHRYSYHDNGKLKQAIIIDEDDEEIHLTFDQQGEQLQ